MPPEVGELVRVVLLMYGAVYGFQFFMDLSR